MSKIKCYVLDTNILMRNPEVLHGFADNEVVLPEIVQRELDCLKDSLGQKGYEARQAANALDTFYARADGDPQHGWPTEGGGIFRIESRPFPPEFLPRHSVGDADCADNCIIAVARMLAEENGEGKPTKLVSGDKIMRQLARNAGLSAEGYKNDEVRNTSFDYAGWTELETDNMQILDSLYKAGCCEVDLQDDCLDENEYAVLRCGKSSARVRYHNGMLYRIAGSPVYGVKPMNPRQSFQMDACLAPASEIPCVIVKGPAGTGKTYIAEACALCQMEGGLYDRIVITRSMVNPDGEAELGVLPGGASDKMDPYLKPFYDNLEQLAENPQQLPKWLASGRIEIQPMGSIRGRTFTNSYIIIDEAQNTSAKQIETLITRLGDGSKIVILGDLNQIDTSRLSRYSNGLAVASERMRGSALTAQVSYLEGDVRRSALARDAVERFGR